MFAITYSLHLLQPVIVSMLDPGDENAARSLGYVPGSVMRGALGMRYIADQGLVDPAHDSTCRALFFDDETLFLDCLPAHQDGKRSLPAPLSWYAEKRNIVDWAGKKIKQLPVFDAAVNQNALLTASDAKPIAAHPQFTRYNENEAMLLASLQETATHIRRPHKLRRIKSEAERSIFTYESLSANQVMAGAILCKTLDGAKKAQSLLKTHAELAIGRSRSAGYGRVRIKDISEPIANWTDLGSGSHLPDPISVEDEEGNSSHFYIVTLMSYVLLRDKNGQFSSDISAELNGSTPVACFKQMDILGGYNRKWGLPILQINALRPGSVFVFKADQVDKTSLLNALQNGIGERLNEGFGRIAVNWQTEPSVFVSAGDVKQAKPPSSNAQEATHAIEIEKIIADAALRRKLDHRVSNKAGAMTIHHPPSNAMLSRIMLAARQAAFARNIGPVAKLLSDVRGDNPGKEKTSRKPAQVALENARVSSQPMGDWLRERVEKCDIDTLLGLAEINPSSITLGSYKAELTPALRAEYTARFIERVTKLAIKKNKKEGAR